MFTQSRINKFEKLGEEFSRPVESIMRCENFKSNFARRLSNRYTSRTPAASPSLDNALKVLPLSNGTPEEVSGIFRGEILPNWQTIKNASLEQNGEAVKPPDKIITNNVARPTEVTALNMEVETLRWQLAQIEANRQMHISLLRQIVTFLNRVKDHIEYQSREIGAKTDTLSARLLPTTLDFIELPRSHSVLHMNKSLECNMATTPKKSNSRKISKSISNVNGFKDCKTLWNQSKLSLTPEKEKTQKMSEEMSRLITLVNTVLSTKIPDLTSSCYNNSENNLSPTKSKIIHKDLLNPNDPSDNFSLMEDVGITSFENGDSSEETVNSIVELKDETIGDMMTSILECTLETVPGVKLGEEVHNFQYLNGGSDIAVKEVSDYKTSHLNEDESGFSSMNSFQEIGIPIISVIPPSPSKEVNYEDISDIIDEAETWKGSTIELDRQTMKVFWV